MGKLHTVIRRQHIMVRFGHLEELSERLSCGKHRKGMVRKEGGVARIGRVRPELGERGQKWKGVARIGRPWPESKEQR